MDFKHSKKRAIFVFLLQSFC